jgi:hypothetical protein
MQSEDRLLLILDFILSQPTLNKIQTKGVVLLPKGHNSIPLLHPKSCLGLFMLTLKFINEFFIDSFNYKFSILIRYLTSVFIKISNFRDYVV